MIRSATSRGTTLAAAANRSRQAASAWIDATAHNNGGSASFSAHESLSTLAGNIGISGGGIVPNGQNNEEDEERRRFQINPLSIPAGAAYSSTFSSTGCSTSKYTYQLQTYRSYHTTSAAERGGPALALGLGAAAAVAKAGQYAARAFKQYQIEAKEAAEAEAQRRKEQGLPSEEEERAQQEAETDAQGKANADAKSKGEEGPRENIFNKFFNMGVGSKFYEGGFEEEMTRREAALILGVRESSTPKRIKEAHRKLLVLNHPDTGGSTYMAGKINEAKELLLKGRKA